MPLTALLFRIAESWPGETKEAAIDYLHALTECRGARSEGKRSVLPSPFTPHPQRTDLTLDSLPVEVEPCHPPCKSDIGNRTAHWNETYPHGPWN